MKNIFFHVMLFVAFTFSSLHANELLFVPLQMNTPEKEFAIWSKVLELLKKESGINLIYKYSVKHSEFLDEIKKGTIAMMYLCPLTYIIAKNNNNFLEPLYAINVEKGSHYYKCIMFTKKDTNITSKNLKGKKFALVSPYATCGFLSANLIYKKQTNTDLKEEDFSYLKTHESVIESVISGKYDIGLTNSIIYSKYLQIFELKKIDETDDLPGFVIAINKNFFNKDSVVKVKDGLKKVFSNESIKNIFPYGVSEVSDKDYNIVRNMLSKTAIYGFPMK